MAAVMASVGAIGKDRENRQQGFKFRGVDDVLNALHGPLVEHGVFVLPEVLDRATETRATAKGGAMNVTRLRMRFTFYGPASDSVAAVTEGEAQDAADKSTNKAMSAAFKYAMFLAFAIPTEEDDADAAGEPAAPERTPAGTAAKAAQGVENGMPTTDAIDGLKTLGDARALIAACSNEFKTLVKQVAVQRRGDGGWGQLWKDEDLKAWSVVLLDACAQMIAGGKGGS
jgi:hypothetical protein